MDAKSLCGIQYAVLGGRRFGYRTPWCDMLGCAGRNMDILHLFYKLADVKEEVHMQTSYLGKHRKTDVAQHLLDLIAMTTDEGDMFLSFLKEAMAKVFATIAKFTKGVEAAYRFEVNCVTVDLPDVMGSTAVTYKKGNYVTHKGELYYAVGDGSDETYENLVPTEDFRESVHYILQYPTTMNGSYVQILDEFVFKALVYYVIWKWLLSAYPEDAATYYSMYEDMLKEIKKAANNLNPIIVDRIPRIF